MKLFNDLEGAEEYFYFLYLYCVLITWFLCIKISHFHALVVV